MQPLCCLLLNTGAVGRQQLRHADCSCAPAACAAPDLACVRPLPPAQAYAAGPGEEKANCHVKELWICGWPFWVLLTTAQVKPGPGVGGSCFGRYAPGTAGDHGPVAARRRSSSADGNAGVSAHTQATQALTPSVCLMCTLLLLVCRR